MLKSFEELKQSGLNYEEFEKVRVAAQEKNKKGLMMGGIIGGAVALIGIIMLAIGSAGLGIGLIVIGIIVFGVYFAIVNSKAKKEIKQKVLGDMLASMNPTFKYSKGDRDFLPRFRKSGFVKSASSTSVDDVFKGQMNGIPFSLGEIHAKKSRKRGNTTTYVTVYQGPFAFAQTAEKYGFTSIIPDFMESAFGGVGKILQKADVSRLNQKNIRIDEDPAFEKVFAVWTKDEQKTREILTPEFRNYLTGLASMSKTYVGWRDEFIYFGMDNRRDLFEIKIKQAISEGTVRQFYDDFANYYNILENVISYITTGAGSGATTNIPGDVPPPPGSDVPPPPTGNTPPPPPQGNNVPPPAGNTPPPPPPQNF